MRDFAALLSFFLVVRRSRARARICSVTIENRRQVSHRCRGGGRAQAAIWRECKVWIRRGFGRSGCSCASISGRPAAEPSRARRLSRVAGAWIEGGEPPIWRRWQCRSGLAGRGEVWRGRGPYLLTLALTGAGRGRGRRLSATNERSRAGREATGWRLAVSLPGRRRESGSAMCLRPPERMTRNEWRWGRGDR